MKNKTIVLLFITTLLTACTIDNSKPDDLISNIPENTETSETTKEITIFYNLTEYTSEISSWTTNKKTIKSKVINLNYKNRTDFSTKIITQSDHQIIFHDACKTSNWKVFAGWWWKWAGGTSRLVQIYPEVHYFQDVEKDDDLRVRDCTVLKDWDNEYIWMVTHWKWKVLIFDPENNLMISELNASFSSSYTGTTMIHEIVTSDLNWDWVDELYLTPTKKNTSTYNTQPWKIYKVEKINGEYLISEFDDFWDRFSKEVHSVEIYWKKALMAIINWTTYSPDEIIKLRNDSNWNDISSVKNPAEIILYHFEDWKIKRELLWTIQTDRCRTIGIWNFWYDWLWIIIPCKNGILNIYSLLSVDNLELKESYKFDKQFLSLYVTNTDNDEMDEIFLWIIWDGLYHFDIHDQEKLFKLVDHSKELWKIWGIIWL